MPRAQIVDNPAAGNHDYGWRQAFGDGLKRHGWRVDHVRQFTGADLLVIWGTRRGEIIRAARNSGAEVCVLERGYIGDRFAYTSVSFGGGLNGRGKFRLARDVYGADRLQELGVTPQPWREDDTGLSLIMGQVPGDQSIRGFDFSRWVKGMTGQLEMLGRKVRHRPHPQDSRWFKGKQQTLEEDLADAGQVVTWNSNSAVDAVLAGVPTVALDEGSMAWDVSGHDPREMIRPNRADWLYRLAWKQYSKDEMESGFCAEAVGLGDGR